MGKGKGHQAGYFPSKAMNRQFQLEWREQLPLQRQRTTTPSETKPAARSSVRPKLRLHSLQALLQEREYDDRMEHSAARQKSKTKPGSSSSSHSKHPHNKEGTPGWIVYHGTNREKTATGANISNGCIPSLQTLALNVLAPVLPNYIDAWGSNMVKYHLSLLPGDTLSDLSVMVSSTIGMTNALCKVLGHHDHVSALSLVAPQDDIEVESTWQALTDEAIFDIIPQWGFGRDTVPINWEDDISAEVGIVWKGCVKLQRLELGNLPHLTAETLEMLLQKCGGITHLGLVGSLGYESGPEILWKMQALLPKLQVLDLSYNPWLTEGLLRGILKSYAGTLTIKAVGTLPLTAQVALENDYPDHFWRTTKKKTKSDDADVAYCYAAIY